MMTKQSSILARSQLYACIDILDRICDLERLLEGSDRGNGGKAQMEPDEL